MVSVAYDPSRFTIEENERIRAGELDPRTFVSSDPELRKNTGLAPGGLAISRPPVQVDPSLSFQNGGTDGAGQPDPVAVDPLGSGVTGGKGSFSLLGDDTPPAVPVFGTEGSPGLEEGAFGFDTGIDRPPPPPAPPADGDVTPFAEPDVEGVEEDIGVGQVPVGGEAPPTKSTGSKITVSGVDFVDFEKAIELLSSGDSAKIVEEYEKKIAGDEILGGLPTPTITFPAVPASPGVRPSEEQTLDITFNRDSNFGPVGWGVWVELVDGEREFRITSETAKAGAVYERALDQITRMEAFLGDVALAESSDARQLVIGQELARVNDELARERQLIADEVAADVREDVQEFQSLQNQLDRDLTTSEREATEKFITDVTQAFQTGEREAAQQFITDYVQQFQSDERKAAQSFITEFVQTFQTGERKAGEEFQKREREAAEEFARDLIQGEGGSQEFTTAERKAGEEAARTAALELEGARQVFATSERENREAFENLQRVRGQEFTSEERRLLEQFTAEQNRLSEGFATRERVAGEQFATSEREEREEFQDEQRREEEGFQTLRDTTNFNRESRLESARLGIANATSDEGIARAVELADEARELDKALAMIDVLEQLSRSGISRQLRDSGILEQLGEQFGVDLNFLLQGGLGTGLGGRAPIRVTA